MRPVQRVLAFVLAAVVIGIGQIDTSAWAASLQSVRVWPCLALIAIGVPLLWSVEKRAADPVLPPALFRSSQLRVVAVIAIAVGGVEAGMVFLPDMAVLNFGVDAATASLTMLPLVLTLAIGAPLAGWLLDHIGPRTVVQLGLTLTVAGLLLFALLPLDWRQFLSVRRPRRLRHVGVARCSVALHRTAGGRREPSRRGPGLADALCQYRPARRCRHDRRRRGVRERCVAGYRQSLLAVAAACGLALVLSAALRGRVMTRREPVGEA